MRGRERERLYYIKYVHMENTYTWSIRTHGVYVHMEYTYTWRIRTHGEVNKLIDTVRGRD